MNLIFPAIASGLIAGAVILFLAHVAPLIHAGNFFTQLDEPVSFRRRLSEREAALLGILLHLFASGLFGAGFGWLLTHGWVMADAFGYAAYTLVVVLVIGGILMPIEGQGIFGLKQDAWFPIDLLITTSLWTVFFATILNIWPGVR